ncbi:MAG: DUF4175 family protein [Armatimonadota bacterium]
MTAMRPYLIRRRVIGAVAGLLVGLALAGLVAGLAVLVLGRAVLAESLLRLALAVVIALPAVVRGALPLRAMDAALAIERTFPFLQDRVATAVDLVSREPDRIPRAEASTLRLADEATAALNDLPLARAAPAHAIRTPALVAVLVLGLAALAYSAAPADRAPEPPPAMPAVAPEAVEPEAPEPPRIFDLSVTIEPPRYSGLPRRTVAADLATIRALAGSTITVTGVCSLQGAEVAFATDGGSPARLQQASGGRVSHSLVLSEPVRWRLEAGADSGSTVTPWRAMEPLEDAPPRVRLVRPEADVTLAMAEPVEITVAAGDDFGISALGLRLRLTDEEAWRSMPLEFTPGASTSASVRLNPAGVGLQPGGELIVWAWARDNDAVTGPKTALSDPVRIRLEEIGAEQRGSEPESPVEEAQREEADAMEELQRTARELQRQLEEAIEGAAGASGQSGEAREMPARPGMDLQEAARRLREQAGRLEQAMREAERELASEQTLPRELVEKVRELHELMRDVMDEDLRRALEERQRAIEAQDREEMRMSLEAAREAQERFTERLEQTLALLRRARMEALLGQLRREAEELAKRQAELTERSEELPDGRTQESREAERDQKLLARDTRPLADRVEAAVEQAREIGEDLAVKLGAIGDRLRREDPVGQMRRAASALDRGSPSGAQGPQQEAGRSLQRAAEDLAELEEELASDFTAEARRKLADASAHLLLKEWREHRHVHENYNSKTGEGCDARSSNRFYHWGGLLGLIPLMEAGHYMG